MKVRAEVRDDGRIQRAGTGLTRGIPLPRWAEPRDYKDLRWTQWGWLPDPRKDGE